MDKLSRRTLIGLAAVTISIVAVAIILSRGGQEPRRPPNASITCPEKSFAIQDRYGDINLTVLLLANGTKPVPGASGYVTLSFTNVSVQEGEGTYWAALPNMSEGIYPVCVTMKKQGYSIPQLHFSIVVNSTRWLKPVEQKVDFSQLAITTNRPQICVIDIQNRFVVNTTVLNPERTNNPLVDVEMKVPGGLNLSTYHYARVNISFWNCPSFRIGLEDQDHRSVWHVFDKASMKGDTCTEWDFKWEEEDAFNMDFGNVTKILLKTRQRYDGSEHFITLKGLTFVREQVDLRPSLTEAINTTLAMRADPLFTYDDTGLPFEFINLKMRSVPQSSDLDFTLGNNEIGEGLTSFWMYYFGSKDEWAGDFLHRAALGEARYLDPGTGMIGLHHLDTRTGNLETDTHHLEGCKFSGGSAGDSSSQHGGEDPMYMMLPAAWYFGEGEAIAALERFSRTLLQINSDPRLIHLHLLIKRCEDKWYAADWVPERGGQRSLVEPRPDAYSDLEEFWWVTPMLGTAVVTRNETLRAEIIARCRIVLDNVIDNQDPDGGIRYVYRMDGSQALWNSTYHRWRGYLLYSFFVRSAYLMDYLTGDEKYINSVKRLFGWLLDGRVPPSYTFASQVVFDAFYTGNDTYIDPLISYIRTTYTPERIRDDISGCIWRLFPYVWNESTEDLEIALEGERRFREENWRPIPPGSQYYCYYTPAEREKILWSRGWCALDAYGSGIEDFYALSQLGSKTKGLIDRDLLILGFLSDVLMSAGD